MRSCLGLLRKCNRLKSGRDKIGIWNKPYLLVAIMAMCFSLLTIRKEKYRVRKSIGICVSLILSCGVPIKLLNCD